MQYHFHKLGPLLYRLQHPTKKQKNAFLCHMFSDVIFLSFFKLRFKDISYLQVCSNSQNIASLCSMSHWRHFHKPQKEYMDWQILQVEFNRREEKLLKLLFNQSIQELKMVTSIQSLQNLILWGLKSWLENDLLHWFCLTKWCSFSQIIWKCKKAFWEISAKLSTLYSFWPFPR